MALAPAARAAEAHLPADSVDGLAAAITAAGPYGAVIVDPGLHQESKSVEIAIPVTILGINGAVIESTTTRAAVYPLHVDASLHVHSVSGVLIQNLELRPPRGTTGGTAVLLEDAPGTVVVGNLIHDYQFGVMVQRSGRSRVTDNDITVTSLWRTDEIPEAHGIVVVNGHGGP